MKHLNNKIILALVAIMILPSFLMVSTNKATVEGKIIWDEEQWFDSSAITTTTFTGVRNVTCFVGPDSAYDLIASTLDKAETSFYLEVYTLSSLSLVNKIIDAHTRGVEVLVLVSHDRVNSYEDDYTETAAYMLDQAGIDVYTASSSFTYTHAKFWIIDHQLTFVYSGNWAPSSIPEANIARTNREMGYMFDDAEIATYYENVLLDDISIGNPTSGVNNGSLPPAETSGTYTHPFDTLNTTVGSMEVTPVFAPDNSYDQIHALLMSATTSIDVELQYINFDCLFYDDLMDAAQRGIAVRIIIPEPDSTTNNVTESFMSIGAQVRFFKATGYDHNKYINVDGQYACVSSINWSNNSVVNNREAGAIVKNTKVAAYFKTVFDWDWANSDVPVGFTVPVSIVAPLKGEAISDIYTFKVLFGINTYTSGSIKIGATTLHTWSNPDGLVTADVDISSYSPGIYTLTATGIPTVGDPIVVENDFNIINPSLDWALLVSEVRYDGVSEPGGEFIELYNGYNQDLLVGGWILTDNEDNYIIPEDTIISAKDVLLLVRDESTFLSEMSGLGIIGVTPDIQYTDLLLANTGDEVILEDPTGTIKDACIWGTGSLTGHTPWTGSMDATKSLHRNPANVDTNDCSVDFEASTPDPGSVYVLEPEVPTVTIVSPKYGEAIADSYLFDVIFDGTTYTSGTIKIDSTIIHTWTNPDGHETANIDISSYTPGIYTLTATGIPSVGDSIITEIDFNIIDSELDWLVLISEVRYDAVTEPGGEFIEIFNGYEHEFLIGGWVLTDGEDSFVIPEDTIISDVNMLVFVRDETIFLTEMTNLGITDASADVVYTNIILSNTGDEVILKDPKGIIKDACVWGTGSLSGHTPWTGSMSDSLSLHRDPANSDTNDCSKDFVADTPDPGTVIITVAPSGFISGYVFGSTVFAIVAVLAIIRFRYKSRK